MALRYVRWGVALVVCSAGAILPYQARALYGRALAFVVHLPYRLFGGLARFLVRRLGLPDAHAP